MFIAGLMALIKGKLTLSKTKIVEGTAARLLGILLMLPIPTALAVGVIWGILLNANNVTGVPIQPPQGQVVAAEVGILALYGISTYVIGFLVASEPAPPRRKGTVVSRRRKAAESDDGEEVELIDE
jgi:hypothetical protein